MDIELVVFDMAGTTLNDEDGVNRCFREALAAVGLPISREAANEVMGIPKPEAIRLLVERAGSPPGLVEQVDAIHNDFVARMIRFYQADPSVREIEGSGAVFQQLRSAGIKVGLNTGFSRDITSVIVERLGWKVGAVVDAIVTSDEVARGRPHPDMIEHLMKHVGVTDPSHVAKVGDTPADLLEGKNAGCRLIIGVTGGTHSREQLEAHPHTHLIGTVADLPSVLEVG